MRSEIERVVEGMIVTIQMWIPLGILPISSSSRSAAVIVEAVEVDSKLNLLNPFSLMKLKYSSVACACINKTSLHSRYLVYFSCNKFSWVPLPTKNF